MTCVGGGARHYTRESRLGSGRGLIVKFAAHDTVHKGFLFLRVSLFQIGAEVSGYREGLRLRRILRSDGVRILPGFIAPDAEWADVRRLRGAFGAEETFSDIPPAFSELCGAESDIDAIQILKDDVIVAIDVAVRGGTSHASTGCGGFERVGVENPIADVDDVDVLFDDDVAREDLVVDPIAESMFFGCSIRPLRPVDVAGEVVGYAADDFSDSAGGQNSLILRRRSSHVASTPLR